MAKPATPKPAPPKPSPPKLYHLARLWVELTRQLHKAVAPELQSQFGSRASLLLIGAAVYLSTIENNPMTASKLAGFIGMPRATVIRKLRTLCRRGVVERSGDLYRTPSHRLDQLARRDHGAMTRLIHNASKALAR